MKSDTRLSITLELGEKVSQVFAVYFKRYSTDWEDHASESTSAHNYSKGKSSPTSEVMQSDRGTWHKNEAYSNTHAHTLAEKHLA